MSSSLEDLIIESARDDIESFDTLRADVSRWATDDGIPYSDEAFAAAVQDLVQSGKLAAFRFDQVSQEYKKIDLQAATQLRDGWFRSVR
jgi:hypothetical protein